MAIKDYWSKLNGRQKTGKEARFNYIMNAIENAGGSGGSSKNYDSDINSLNSKIASLESTIETMDGTISELQSTVASLQIKNGDEEDIDEI